MISEHTVSETGDGGGMLDFQFPEHKMGVEILIRASPDYKCFDVHSILAPTSPTMRNFLDHAARTDAAAATKHKQASSAKTAAACENGYGTALIVSLAQSTPEAAFCHFDEMVRRL